MQPRWRGGLCVVCGTAMLLEFWLGREKGKGTQFNDSIC